MRTGLPRAAFYVALFYFITLVFGPEYGFVASVTGTAFNFSYQKKLTFGGWNSQCKPVDTNLKFKCIKGLKFSPLIEK